MTSRHLALTVEGLTHASSVIALDRCTEAAWGMVISALVPLNCNALPYLPEAHVAFVIVPLLPLPDTSVTVVPDPSSNPNAATSPGVAAIEAGAATNSATPITAAIATAPPQRRVQVAQPARNPSPPRGSALTPNSFASVKILHKTLSRA